MPYGRAVMVSWLASDRVRSRGLRQRELYTMDDVYVHAADDLLRPLRYHTGAVYLVTPKDAALYEELGGDGEYLPGRGRERTSARRLGPCQYWGHTPGNASSELPSWRLLPSVPSPPSAQEVRIRTEGYANLIRAVHQRGASRAQASLSPAVDRVPLGICLLCGQEHETCQFGRGLVCVRDNCPNPHHRLASESQT